MTDLAAIPDDELMAMYAMPALIKQESGGRAGALGPPTKYGRAEGMTQMLPATAQAMATKLGVPWRPELMRADTPEGADYQERLGQAYLQEGIAKTGSLKGGFHYYHGGPDQKQWGPKTKAYGEAVMTKLGTAPPQSDLSALSDEELMAMYSQEAPEPVVEASVVGRPELGVGKSFKAPAPPRKAAPAPGPTIAQDAASGFLEPFQNFGRNAKQYYTESVARSQAGPPKSLAELGEAMKGSYGGMAGLMGDAVGLLGAPVQAAVRPAARQIAKLPIDAYAKPTLTGVPRKIVGDEKQQMLEGVLNTALSAAQPARARAPVPPRPKAKSVDELFAERKAAYAQVDASGYKFQQKDLKALAADAVKAVDDAGGPELNEQAAKMANRIQALADRGDLSLSQLDKVRAQVGEKVIAKGEPTVGYALRDMVDGLIDSAQIPEMRAAREVNTRYMKVKEVTDRLESADLAKAPSGNGGNSNAPRQKLKPLLDPKSSQRMKNLTPEEAKALRKVVKPSAGESALRALSAFDPTAGKLQALLQTMAAIPTGGMSALTAPVGMAARVAEGAMTKHSVESLLKLMSSGGAKAAKIPLSPSTAIPRVRLLSPGGLIGAGTTARPLAEIPAPRPAKTSAPRAKSKQKR